MPVTLNFIFKAFIPHFLEDSIFIALILNQYCSWLSDSNTQEMPRGRRETHKPETADSHRGRRRLPWRKEGTCKRKWRREHWTVPLGDYSSGIKWGCGGYFINKTETLVNNKCHRQYSLADDIQLVTKEKIEDADHGSNPSSLEAAGVSGTASQAANSLNISKPLSLFPFLGMPSTVGTLGSITSPTSPSLPQWMQLGVSKSGSLANDARHKFRFVMYFCWIFWRWSLI